MTSRTSDGRSCGAHNRLPRAAFRYSAGRRTGRDDSTRSRREDLDLAHATRRPSKMSACSAMRSMPPKASTITWSRATTVIPSIVVRPTSLTPSNGISVTRIPLPPVDGVVGVLEEVRRSRGPQAVRHVSTLPRDGRRALRLDQRGENVVFPADGFEAHTLSAPVVACDRHPITDALRANARRLSSA